MKHEKTEEELNCGEEEVFILSTLKSREFDTPLMRPSQLEGFHFKFFHTKIRGPKFCHNGNPFVLIFFTQKLGGPLFFVSRCEKEKNYTKRNHDLVLFPFYR